MTEEAEKGRGIGAVPQSVAGNVSQWLLIAVIGSATL